MAVYYAEFDSLGTSLLADLQTRILTSTNWTRPNSGTFPTLYTATTARGAQMAIDLNTTAITLNTLTATVYRTHDGTTGTDPLVRCLRIKAAAGGTLATNTYHTILSVGPNHFFLSIEGPKVGETGPDSATVGSVRNYLFISDLVPYYASDTTPTVVVGGGSAATAAAATWATHAPVYVMRNGANSLSVRPGFLITSMVPGGNSSGIQAVQIPAAMDGGIEVYHPYRYVDNTEGERGRLSSFFFAGFNVSTTPIVSHPTEGAIVTIEGSEYKLVAANRSDSANQQYGPFGMTTNASTATLNHTAIIAVPYS